MQEHGNDDSFDHEFLRVYMQGPIPSVRQLQYISAILECTIVWATIALLIEKADFARSLRYRSRPSEEEKRIVETKDYKIACAIDKEKVPSIRKSYKAFLRKRYEPMVLQILAESGYSPPMIINKDSYRTDHMSWFDQFINRKSLGNDRFDFVDFNLWIGEEFPQPLIKTNEILTTKSLEFILDIGVFLGIFTLQSVPVAKDIFTYSAGMLKQCIVKGAGKGVALEQKEKLRLPELPSSYGRLIEQYDKVELEMKRDHFVMNLSRRTPS